MLQVEAQRWAEVGTFFYVGRPERLMGLQPAEGDALLMAVLGSWGCYNKVPQAVWHRHQKCIVSQFWRLEAQDEVVSGIGSSWRL